jgi:integrase
MARGQEQVQRNGQRLRMVAYHLDAGKGKHPYVYIGQDEARAKRLQHLLRSAIEDSQTAEAAQEAVNHLLAAPSDEEVKTRLAGLLRDRMFRTPFTGREVEYEASQGDLSYFREEPHYSPVFLQSFRHPEIRQRVEREMGGEAPSREKLSDCLNKWLEWKQLQGKTEQHRSEYEAVFKTFIEVIGDIPVSQLRKTHITEVWPQYLAKARGKRGPRWVNTRLMAVSAVFRLCRRKTEWPFPEGLRDWICNDGEYVSYKPNPSNRKALPVAVFKSMLATAEEWAAIDVTAKAEAMPVDPKNPKLSKMNAIKQARRIQRAGVQWVAILRFAVQTAADNSDICCLEWEHLHDLDGALPYVELRRPKTDEFRLTPLLPGTVAALRRWRGYESDETLRAAGKDRALANVFRNDGKKPFDSHKVSEGFERLRDAIENGNGWSFKHLRNVGPNVARNHGRSKDEREALLGHAVEGTNWFYEYTPDARFLLPLVNVIGREYLEGDQIPA